MSEPLVWPGGETYRIQIAEHAGDLFCAFSLYWKTESPTKAHIAETIRRMTDLNLTPTIIVLPFWLAQRYAASVYVENLTADRICLGNFFGGLETYVMNSFTVHDSVDAVGFCDFERRRIAVSFYPKAVTHPARIPVSHRTTERWRPHHY